MKIIEKNLEFKRGNTFSKSFIIENFNYEIDQIYLTIKENENDKNYVLQKRLENGINLVDDSTTSKTYNFTIDATDTDNFKSDYNYYYDIKIISGTKKFTIIEGNLILSPEITKTINEVTT